MRLKKGKGVRGEERRWYGANETEEDFLEDDSWDPTAKEAAAYNRKRLAIAEGKKQAHGARTVKRNKATNKSYARRVKTGELSNKSVPT